MGRPVAGEVEVPFETLIGDRLVRGRIDAVFADAPGGGYDVVDWKTGRPPASADEERAVAVQLAAYRLAWAALAGVPVDEVRAAFYYVRGEHHGPAGRPAGRGRPRGADRAHPGRLFQPAAVQQRAASAPVLNRSGPPGREPADRGDRRHHQPRSDC